MKGIYVRFERDGKILGYCIGQNEGDHLGFSADLLKSLVGNPSKLDGASMVIVESKQSFPVRVNQELLVEGELSVRCG